MRPCSRPATEGTAHYKKDLGAQNRRFRMDWPNGNENAKSGRLLTRSGGLWIVTRSDGLARAAGDVECARSAGLSWSMSCAVRDTQAAPSPAHPTDLAGCAAQTDRELPSSHRGPVVGVGCHRGATTPPMAISTAAA